MRTMVEEETASQTPASVPGLGMVAVGDRVWQNQKMVDEIAVEPGQHFDSEPDALARQNRRAEMHMRDADAADAAADEPTLF